MPRPTFRLPDGSPNLAEIRHEYQRAVANGSLVGPMLDSLGGLTEQYPLVLAFVGALETLKARDLWLPFDKLEWSRRSQATLARAVAQAPQHVEVRFLRYSIQLGLPGYLHLNQHLAEDKAAILQLLGTPEAQALGPETVRTIANFMINQGRCSPAEQQVLRELLLR
jgi:hypothetical protein